MAGMAQAGKLPKKKRSVHNQTFSSIYEHSFPEFTKSRLGESYAFCKVCICDISVAHGGKTDLARHLTSAKHIANHKLSSSNSKLSNFFSNSKSDDDVIRAEVIFTKFLIEKNLPISVADHSGQMFRNMFKDSDIAKKYVCARTKTTAIMDALAKDDDRILTQDLLHHPFSIATDGSNDYENKKLYLVVIRVFDPRQGQVISTLLSMPECTENSTGENIFGIFDEELSQRNISWKNCLSFAADNASVMRGIHKGVISYIEKKNPKIYMLGCPCHLIHLAAEKGGKCLRIRLDELLVDIYYYLEKSAKRHAGLRKFQELHNTEIRKILKHVSTRWLSLETCVNRLLQQWEPLRDYFGSECKETYSTSSILRHGQKQKQPGRKTSVNKDGEPAVSKMLQTSQKPSSQSMSSKQQKVTTSCEKKSSSPKKSRCSKLVCSKAKKTSDKSTTKSTKSHKSSSMNKESRRSSQKSGLSRVERVFGSLSDKTSKLYCLFLKSVLPRFNIANILLQKEEPYVHKLHATLEQLLKDIMCRFVKVRAVKESGSFTTVNYKEAENQKSDDQLSIGFEAREFIAEHKDSITMESFYKDVRNYFITSTTYMLEKFPLGDEVLIHCQVADISRRTEFDFSSITFLIKRFPCLTFDLGQLEQEFLTFQVENLQDQVLSQQRMDIAWNEVSHLKSPVTAIPKFGQLAQFMLSVLSIFHSNADCERIFSYVTKTKTQFRPTLGARTLNSLVDHKVNMLSREEHSYNTVVLGELLKKAKSATYNSLKNV